ncbi:MAG: response regulator transcription factor [Verrucomicrobiota bacterium]
MSPPNPIRLLLVDDHYFVRMGIAAVLGIETDMVVTGEAEDSEGALLQYKACHPDVTLLDLRMPGIGGLETLRLIRKWHPGARVIVLTTSGLEEDVFQALEAGAAGYLLKTAKRAEVAAAIRCVHSGGLAIPQNIVERLADRRHRKALSHRELEVLTLLRRGLSNKEIGVALGVSEHTGKAHVKAILAKLSAADRAEAVAISFRLGLLSVKDS